MYENKKIADVVDHLHVNPQTGLTQIEAEKRLRQYRKNELIQKPPKTFIEMFLEQLNDPLIFILFIAAAISMLLKEFSDAGIILAVIAMNAIVGVVQEGKAQKALEALKKMTSPTALVKREGVIREMPAAQLVPGDVVILEAGRQIPADLRLLSSSSLKIEESALTGESVPVEKDAAFTAKQEVGLGECKNMAFMSTSVIYGRGEGVVSATGMQTEIGKIAGLINEAPTEATPLQKRLADLGKLLSMVSVLLCVLLFGIAVWQQRNILDMLITAISLAVAAVPEGLPAVVTIVLALSVSRMVKVNTIIRRLPSVETLGAVSIVCSDKTGTLTQNKMTVVECFTNQKRVPLKNIDKRQHAAFLEGFLLCNDSFITEENKLGDPTELALVQMAADGGLNKKEQEKITPRIDEIPFDSNRKMMTTVHRKDGGSIAYTKGSCDAILKRCTHILADGQIIPITHEHKREIIEGMNQMSLNALRVLALAQKKNGSKPWEQGLTFVGLVGMMDPARPEVAEAICLFKKATVKVVMITGDHINTAFAIAKDLAIADNLSQCISGDQLNQMSAEELSEKIEEVCVFARVSPEHKVRIVNAFKEKGRIVAMTGDGVNDAPSLKAADIGIAMGLGGTDVAKNASDIILTDDNFATIEKAIEEGRGVYENIKKSVLFLLSSNFGEIITMFFSILAGLATPLRASHILWVNLITDSLPALALGVDENDTKLLMKKPPRNPQESLFAHGGLTCTLFYGSLIAAISLVAFLTLPYGLLKENNMAITLENLRQVLMNATVLIRAQTYAFTVLGMSELFHALGMRNVEQSFLRINHRANKLMIVAFVVGMILQVAVTEVPYLVSVFGTSRLAIKEWLYLVGLSSTPLIAHEFLVACNWLVETLRKGSTKENPTATEFSQSN